MVVTAKITSKGQITLPKEVRRLLKVDAGAVVVFEKEDDKVIVRTAKTLREFKGFLKGKSAPTDFAVMRSVAKKHHGDKLGRVKRQ
jgi:AbrB family looped-hinge helix DNA binding protein